MEDQKSKSTKYTVIVNTKEKFKTGLRKISWTNTKKDILQCKLLNRIRQLHKH